MQTKLNLFQKLIEIRKGIDYIQKNETGQNSSYVSIDVLLSKVVRLMNANNVLLITNVVESDLTQITTPTGNNKEKQSFLSKQKLKMIWIDADNPSDKIEVDWFADGANMQNASFAGGGALTYYIRYFLIYQFNIPTSNDDPEKYIEKLEGQKLVDETDLIKLRKALKDKNLSEKVVCHNYSDNKYTMQDISELTKNQCKESINLAKNTPITNP